MYIIKSIHPEKYNSKDYMLQEGFMHKRLPTSTYCITFQAELEPNEDTQYPLEDILDNYAVNCTDDVREYMDGDRHIFVFELESDELDVVKRVSHLVGKRVYNQLYTKDGVEYIKLVIE